MRMKDFFTQEIFQDALTLKSFGPKPAALAAYGLESFTYETDCGLTLECELEFDEGDASVGLVDSATLISACVGEHDIFNVLGLRVIDMIEHAFLSQPMQGGEWD